MTKIQLVRFFIPDKNARLGCLMDETISDISYHISAVREWLRRSMGQVEAAIDQLEDLANRSKEKYPLKAFQNAPDPTKPHLLTPVYAQEIWGTLNLYQVQETNRPPVLYFKAQGKNSVGHLDEVGLRRDAIRTVPEPTLAVILNPSLEVVGFTLANDLTCLDLFPSDPLYLSHAKVYTASCAIGPTLNLRTAQELPNLLIRMRVERDHQVVFAGEFHTAGIQRKLAHLIDYLGRSNEFIDGAVLLTGTGITPPPDFTLQAGDTITMSADGLLSLQNRVKLV